MHKALYSSTIVHTILGNIRLKAKVYSKVGSVAAGCYRSELSCLQDTCSTVRWGDTSSICLEQVKEL